MEVLKRKISANSLVITVVLSFIIVSICFSIMLISYYYSGSQLKYISSIRLGDDLESGINILLLETDFTGEEKSETISVYSDSKDSVTLKRSTWGTLRYNYVNAFNQLGNKEQSFFSSNDVPDSLNCALYLVDHQRPLSISKTTQIDGAIYLPAAGIVEQRYSANIVGDQRPSFGKLPTFNQELQTSYTALINSFTNKTNICNTAMIGGIISQKFNDSLLNINSNETIQLLSGSYTGKIIISSSKSIVINAGVICKNIIVIAPKIIFKDGFKGTLQAFATDSLIIGSDCLLEYPSVLMLKQNVESKEQSRLFVGNRTMISGSVFCISTKIGYPKIMAEFRENSVVEGLVFVHGFLDLRSKVYGTVFTDFFIHRDDVAMLENRLTAPLISRSGLPFFLTPPSGFSNSESLKIICWIE